MYAAPCYRKVQTTHLRYKICDEDFSPIRPIRAMRTMRTSEGQP